MMTNEFKQLFDVLKNDTNSSKKYVIASVVHVKGSSYRRPGVRMLISSEGEMFGAISGGCVEKEVLLQSASIFRDGIPKMMEYDGRLRLGCEGIITILIEIFFPSEELFLALYSGLRQRKSIEINSHYNLSLESNYSLGTTLRIDETEYTLDSSNAPKKSENVFNQTLLPLFRLYIFGSEHDTVELCKLAATIGWEIIVVAPPNEKKTMEYFKGASQLICPAFREFESSQIDKLCAVILMTHSIYKDLEYLISLRETFPAYFGILGPSLRKKQVIEKLIEYHPDCSLEFIEQIRGPVGLDIGAESASEIAISILSEILSVIRNKSGMALTNKKLGIHE